MTKSKAVLLEVQDKVATVTLNRPQARNAVNAEVIDGLGAAAGGRRGSPARFQRRRNRLCSLP